MIDATKEELLTFADVARRLPPNGRGNRIKPLTVWRWHKYGLKDNNNGIVRLEAKLLGRRLLTTMGCVQRFMDALNGGELKRNTIE